MPVGPKRKPSTSSRSTGKNRYLKLNANLLKSRRISAIRIVKRGAKPPPNRRDYTLAIYIMAAMILLS